MFADGEICEEDAPDERKALVVIGLKSFLFSKEQNRGTIQRREITPIEGRFPNTEAILPTNKPVATARVDPELMLRLLKAALAFADGCSPAMTIEFHEGITTASSDGKKTGGTPLNRVVFRVKNLQDQEFTGVIVQLAPSN